MRRGEGCIDWIVRSTIHEDNKLSLLTCPASFPLSSQQSTPLALIPFSVFPSRFVPLFFCDIVPSLLACFLCLTITPSGHVSLSDFFIIGAGFLLMLLPLNNTLSQNKVKH